MCITAIRRVVAHTRPCYRDVLLPQHHIPGVIPDVLTNSENLPSKRRHGQRGYTPSPGTSQPMVAGVQAPGATARLLPAPMWPPTLLPAPMWVFPATVDATQQLALMECVIQRLVDAAVAKLASGLSQAPAADQLLQASRLKNGNPC